MLEGQKSEPSSSNSTEPKSGIDPGVHKAIKDAILSTFSDLSANPLSVIESRISDLKRNLSDEQESALASKSKRFKKSEPEFKSRGNKAQFQHRQLVLEKLTESRDSLACAKYEKAKEAIGEGISLSEKHIKVIRLADRSEFGWSTVKEYLPDELASNSEDEKRIFHSERRAEHRSKQASSRHRSRAASRLGKEVKSTWFFERFSSTRFPGQTGALSASVPRSRISPCYKLSIHFYYFCHLFYSLVFRYLPHYFSALFNTLLVLVSRGTHYSPLSCVYCLCLMEGYNSTE